MISIARKSQLWQRILAGLVVGLVAGALLGESALKLSWIGDSFMRLIRMLIIPLVATTLVSGIVAMGSPKKLGSIGVKAVGLYLLTTALAITIGLTLAALLEPGDGVSLAHVTPIGIDEPRNMVEQLVSIIPVNPIAAMAEGEVLSVILFSVLIGVGILLVGEPAKPVSDFFDAASAVVLKITHLVMELAPIGVFALIAVITGTQGLGALQNILGLGLAVYAGCMLHVLLVQGSLFRISIGLPFHKFLRRAVDAQLVAFSTASSAATLPVTLTVAKEKLGVGAPVASSVLPLGSTINMDGAAIYVSIVTLFAAQVFGIKVAFGDYLLIGLATTLISVGAAAVPTATLFLLAAVLGVIGVTETQAALVVGFVLPFDRLLDMVRTATNVTGDLVIASSVAEWEGELDRSSITEPE